MQKFLITAATALALATTAQAAGHATTFGAVTMEPDRHHYASDLIGMNVWATETDLDANMAMTVDGTTEWDDIGEIDNIILDRDGNVVAVVIGVGGFLGLGERNVAVTMDQLMFVPEDGGDDFFIVVKASRADIEAAPELVVAEREMEADTVAMTETKAEEMDDARVHLMPPTITREGYSVVTVDALTAEDLDGEPVYGTDDSSVGEISSLILDDNGKITKAVIDVGGFLGIGEKPVAVSFDALTIVRDESGATRVYIDASQEALEALPRHEG